MHSITCSSLCPTATQPQKTRYQNNNNNPVLENQMLTREDRTLCTPQTKSRVCVCVCIFLLLILYTILFSSWSVPRCKVRESITTTSPFCKWAGRYSQLDKNESLTWRCGSLKRACEKALWVLVRNTVGPIERSISCSATKAV